MEISCLAGLAGFHYGRATIAATGGEGSRLVGPTPRVVEASSSLRDDLVCLRDGHAVERGSEVDVRAPLLPGGEPVIAEVETGRMRCIGNGGIVAPSRAGGKARP